MIAIIIAAAAVAAVVVIITRCEEGTLSPQVLTVMQKEKEESSNSGISRTVS